jgi:cytochrome c biogenesis protein CcdA
MNENRLMQQITAIFSVFMVFFYLGVGIYFIFYFNNTTIDKPVRVILGSTFVLYGVYRAARSYSKIREVFFTKKDDRDNYGHRNRI